MSGYDRLDLLHKFQNSIDAHTAHKWHLTRMRRLCYFDLFVEGSVLAGCTYCGIQSYKVSRVASALASTATGTNVVARPGAGFMLMMFCIAGITGFCAYTDFVVLRNTKAQLVTENRAIAFYEGEASKVVNGQWKADPEAREIRINKK